MRNQYAAPWSTKVKATTVAVVGLLIAVAIIVSDIYASLTVLGILVLCRVYSVRGYSVAKGQLRVHRMGWAKRFDLATLEGASYTPGAMTGSIRTWGIGGVFGYIGNFRSATLGPYKAYATDPERTVVLRFAEQTVVVTPKRPAEFVEAVRAA